MVPHGPALSHMVPHGPVQGVHQCFGYFVFLQFLSLQSTLDKTFGPFCEDHKILISEMSLIFIIDQYLTEIWPSQCWVPYLKINI